MASQFTQTEISAVNFVDADRVWFKSSVGFRCRESKRENSLSSYVVDNTAEGVFEINNWRKHPRFLRTALIHGLDSTQFFAGTAIRCPLTGQPVGVLCVLDTQPRRLTRFQRASLELFSEQISLILKLEFVQNLLRNRRDKYRREVHKLKVSFEAPKCVVVVCARLLL